MTASRRLPILASLASLTLATALSAQPLGTPKPDPSFPFSTEIEDFARADDGSLGGPDTTLFLGSSSIRLWNVRAGFPALRAVNRGFGGATTPDVLHYYDRLRPSAAPRSILVYVGENDLSAGASPERVARDILTLLGKLRADYPRARIACLSLKPSPIRWTHYPLMQAVNRAVAAKASAARFDYLEVGEALLAGDGLPDASLFRPDGLHMNPRGYALWNRLVAQWLGADGMGVPAKAAGAPAKGVAVAAKP